MGYRSEVVLVIDKKTLFVEKVLKKGLPCLLQDGASATTYGEFIYYPFTDIKWYDSYEDIRTVNDFMDQMDDDNISYGFIRVGEGINDIEIRGNPDEFDMYTTTRIEY